ncbi:uncharacterized protein EDB93DRAFT_367949 [Suillus bovinus]|uniref:uncharacterized protein n=1 Tax=Suillus bovinus TaxID=48563 RepID=UPI001B8825EB|nr:uncharacterized protein EDB93DRAFT_367949 [Suillus bovinus]KAG2148659.1 hypothetical protein EDB93DRAFT_367949 [Suillus bovinus]
MSADTNNNSSASNTVHIEYVIHPERDNHFRAQVATSSKFLKANQKKFGLQCTQCQTKLEKPLKCTKCKSVWYCSKEVGSLIGMKPKTEWLTCVQCQKKNWSTHKPTCREVERSLGVLKFIQMFSANPLLMTFLKFGIVFDWLFDNTRIGFNVPFIARIDIAMELSNILDFAGLYFYDKAVGEKLQGMLQVNAITPWHPKQGPLTVAFAD